MFWTNNPVRNVGFLTTHDPTIEQGGVTYYGILKYWTGVVWIAKMLKTYLSGTWQTKPLKRWDGSGWKEINTAG